MTAGTAEQRRLAAEVTAALGMEPRLLRLISAVHEAGHAIVGATVGFEVTEARAETVEAIGSNEVTADFGPGRDVPLSDLCPGRQPATRRPSPGCKAAASTAPEPPTTSR